MLGYVLIGPQGPLATGDGLIQITEWAWAKIRPMSPDSA
jgi:hypothetical protein